MADPTSGRGRGVVGYVAWCAGLAVLLVVLARVPSPPLGPLTSDDPADLLRAVQTAARGIALACTGYLSLATVLSTIAEVTRWRPVQRLSRRVSAPVVRRVVRAGVGATLVVGLGAGPAAAAVAAPSPPGATAAREADGDADDPVDRPAASPVPRSGGAPDEGAPRAVDDLPGRVLAPAVEPDVPAPAVEPDVPAPAVEPDVPAPAVKAIGTAPAAPDRSTAADAEEGRSARPAPAGGGPSRDRPSVDGDPADSAEADHVPVDAGSDGPGDDAASDTDAGDPAPEAGDPDTTHVGDADTPVTDRDEHVVRAGDSFWSIAEGLVRDAGREPTDAEVAPVWLALIAANRDRLAVVDDPDLLLPGQRLTVDVPHGAEVDG